MSETRPSMIKSCRVWLRDRKDIPDEKRLCINTLFDRAEPAVVVAESETATEDGQDISEDIEEYADSVEEWAARKAAVSDIPKCYFIKLKDNSELTVYGVCEVIDRITNVAFVGKSGKAVIVTAAELVYYCEKNDIDTLGDISVE